MMMVMVMILTMVMIMAMILYGDYDDFDNGDDGDFDDGDDDDCFAGVSKGRPDHHLYNPPAISQVPFVTILRMMMVLMIL